MRPGPRLPARARAVRGLRDRAVPRLRHRAVPRLRHRAVPPLLLFLVVAGVYLPSARFGFLYDDFEIILMQAAPRSAGDVARLFAEPHGLPLSQLPYYRATTRASLLVQKAVHGDRPGPFHVFNALLMGVAALGAYAVLRHRRFRLPAAAAALGAAAFALHPASSSAVYPIASGRETLLPVTCALFAVACHLRGGVGGRAAAAGLLGLTLLGKEQGIVVPLLFVLADALRLTPDPPGRSARAWALRLAPPAAVVAGYLAVRSAAFGPGEGEPLLPLLAQHWRTTWWGPPTALAYALQTWIAPFGRVVYEPDLADWLRPLRLAAAGGVFAGLAAAALCARRDDRAPVWFWLLWIPAGMALTLRVLPQEAPYAERFLLLSTLAPAALAATVGAELAHRRPERARALVAAGCAGVALLAALGLGRAADFRDDLAFAARWAAARPGHPVARFAHGNALARRGRTAEALGELRAAAALEPGFAPAHYNLGVLLARQGRHDEARAAFRAAVRADPEDAAAREALRALDAGP